MLWPPTPWPLPPVNGWNMAIDRYRGHTRVTVDAPVWKARAVSVRAYSWGIERRALVPEEWPEGLARRVSGRVADNHGGEKGRVLYIGRRTATDERMPLAVAAWHLPDSGPLELLDLDVALVVREQRPDLVGPCAVSLLALLRAIAAHKKLARPGDRLAWITDKDEVARRAYEQWGFRGLKPSARPEGCMSRHYMQRIER
jgi:hypothetical protein